MRQIVLDTETTGLRPEEGHRIIEVGCVELVNRKLTGNNFHYYINPNREIDAGAIQVHGITNDFLKDKPPFSKIARELLDYLSGAELIIHNAPFDVGFLDSEFKLTRGGYKPISSYCGILDTLPMARKKHAGQRNTLDALCKRYAVDNTRRELHGALMDASLLAHVYLAMTGGQGNFFDSVGESQEQSRQAAGAEVQKVLTSDLTILYADGAELEQHQAYLKDLDKKNACLWLAAGDSKDN